MKKLLKWIIPYVFVILPTMGTELPYDVIRDPFFVDKSTITTIHSYIENDGKFFAVVTGTHQVETDRDGVPLTKSEHYRAAFKIIDRRNDDFNLLTYETILLQVGLSGSPLPLTKQVTRDLPYILLGKSGEGRFLRGINLGLKGDLPVNEVIDVREILRYRRPYDTADSLAVEKPGELLHQLLLEETSAVIGSGWVATCVRCNAKHNLQAYSNARNVTSSLWQIPRNGEKIQLVQTIAKRAILSTLYPDRRDHNIKADLSAAEYLNNMQGWIIR